MSTKTDLRTSSAIPSPIRKNVDGYMMVHEADESELYLTRVTLKECGIPFREEKIDETSALGTSTRTQIFVHPSKSNDAALLLKPAPKTKPPVSADHFMIYYWIAIFLFVAVLFFWSSK